MKYKDADGKLKHAMKLFEDAVDHTVEAHDEAHRAERFYHNTECEGQWEAEDLEYLRASLRPAFSFNIIKSKLDTFFGMYADAQRTPVVVGTGKEDELLAQVINHVKDQVLQDANYEGLAGRQLKTGTIAGECSLHLEVVPSEDGPDWIKLNIYRILPFELHWDIASVEPDRNDARYLFWDRWLDEDEFNTEYPDYEGEWKAMGGDNAYEGTSEGDGYNDRSENQLAPWDKESDYRTDRWNRYYYDRQKNKARVVRYEYKTFVEKTYVTDEQTGQRSELDEKQVERVELAIDLGAALSLSTKTEEVVEVCEFIGDVLLEEYDTAGPFKGFSITPYCYDIDEETGTAYGPIRNLFDPQMELNKSKSLEIEYLAQGTAPGVIAEEGAIPDEDAFSDAMRMPGGVAITTKDALTTGRVTDRVPTPPSPAVAMRLAGAMELLTEVSGIPSAANITAAEHAQSGVSVAIRYHKSRQTVSSPFANFELSQTRFCEKVVQALTTAMPEDQIASILDKEGDMVIQDGTITELMPDPNGGEQMVPKAQAQLADIHNMKWRLDMEYTSENSTLRMLEMSMLLDLTNAGVPVDPEVLVEKATSSKSTRERLKSYVEKAQQAEAEGSKAQADAIAQQSQQFVQVEMEKVRVNEQRNAEQARHNLASEDQDMIKDERSSELQLLTIWEKADAAEKARIMERIQFADKLTTEARV